MATIKAEETRQRKSKVQELNRQSEASWDTSKSDQIVQRFRQATFKSKRKRQRFSTTVEATVEEIFPLLCPTREADWITGWDCELIYSESGYMEEDCVFRTDKSNVIGEGIWVGTGFKVNQYADYLWIQEDVVSHIHITLSDNNDGTVVATWDVLLTGLTERGNEEIEKLPEENPRFTALFKMLDHYLKNGKAISRTSLVVGMLAQGVKGRLGSHLP